MACAFVYFPAIYFFQFLILRNANNGAFDILIKYIPSIAIGFFGIFIRKKILQDKNDKDAKLWLKLGELLTTEQVNDDNKNEKYLESLRAAYPGLPSDAKLWLKLGELLTTEQVNEENKNNKYLESLRAAYRVHNQGCLPLPNYGWNCMGELLTTEQVNEENKNNKYLESLRAAYRMH